VGGRKINDCQSSHKVWTLDNNTFTAHPVKIELEKLELKKE
jgi:HlyD family secretion protein